MKKNSVVFTAVLFGVAATALAQAQPSAPAAAAPVAFPTRIAIINMSDAVRNTKEGQKAAAEISSKYGPRQAEYDKRKQELDALNDQLGKGRATMSEEAQKKLGTDIQTKTTNLKRFGEDTAAEAEQDDQKIGQELSSKMYQLVQQYAPQNGYAVVLDVSGQGSPVLWAANSTFITDIMTALYDQAHPVKDAPAAAAPKPPAAPPSKKQ